MFMNFKTRRHEVFPMYALAFSAASLLHCTSPFSILVSSHVITFTISTKVPTM